jgi:uncharacterized membrane protein YagU involved in acid resistance
MLNRKYQGEHMNTFTLLLHVIGLGVGATLVMDFGLWILKQLNIPTLNFALLGRWVGWMFRGKFTHQAIGRSPAIQYEYLLGWIAHYSVGVFFAFSFVLIVGDAWLLEPKFWSALLFGICTVAIPFFIMQPAMGAGIASANTPQPLQNRLKSMLNHSIFGCGLYLTAQLLQII